MTPADPKPEAGMLLSALIYARRGWPVFPLRPRSKEPYEGIGVYQATCDEGKIREWWRKWPDSNIAVAMGERSGIFLFDVDTRKPGCQEDFAELQLKNGSFPETAEAISGSGGLHFFFSHPDFLVHSSTAKLGRGIDIKAFGSYCVMSPSVHPDSGKRYAWSKDVAVVPAPEWLLAWLRAQPDRERLTNEEIESIPEGRRDETIFKLACYFRRRGLSVNEISAALLEINRGRCNPPLPDAQVKSKAISACRYSPDDPFLSAPEEKKAVPGALVSISAPDLLDLELPPRKLLMRPWLGQADQCAIYGKRGHGKTWVTLGSAIALSSGGSMWGWSVENPVRVLFVDGEMMMRRLQSRLQTLMRSLRIVPTKNLFILTPDAQPGNVSPVNLYSKEGRLAVAEHIDSIGGVDVMILDNISTLYRGGEENTSEWWQPLQDWLVEWRMRGVATVCALHSGKDGDRGPRGASKVEDALEVSIEVRQSEDWIPSDGASFTVDFKKARDFEPGMEKLEVELVENEWSFKTARSSHRESEVSDEEMDARVLAAVQKSPGRPWREVRQGIGKIARATHARNRLENRHLIRVEKGSGIDYRKVLVWPN